MTQQQHLDAIKRGDAIISKLGSKMQEAYDKGRMEDYEMYSEKLGYYADFTHYLKSEYAKKYEVANG